jgi:UDP-GlcNAc:undecaprenyl-phosphate GlcNAc-1-phosphate transferase
MIAAILCLIPAAFALSCPLTWAAGRLGRRWGQLDMPGGRKAHQAPTPATGGMAIFATIAGLAGAAMAGVHLAGDSFWQRVLPAAAAHLPGAARQTPMALGLLACLAALHGMGVIDDRRGLGPFVKLGAQLVCGAVMAIGFEVRLLELLGPAASVAVTVLWFAALTNAFNFLDNMDGLAGGVAAICAAVLLAAALLHGQWFIAGMLAVLIGSLLGFLVFNFPPASIFMGDGGSLIVGFLLAFCSVRLTYLAPGGAADGGQPGGWWAVLTPLVVMAIPLYDLASVTLIRLAQGRSPFVGDAQHFSHRLVRKGLSRRAAVVVIWCCTLATALGGVMLASAGPLHAGLIAAQTAAVLATLALLERGGSGS